MGSVLAKRANWLELIEAIHSPTVDEQRWGEGILSSAQAIFRTSHGVGFSIVDHSASCAHPKHAMLAMPKRFWMTAAEADRGLSALGVEGLRAYYYPPGLLSTHREIERQLMSAPAAAVRSAAGVGDAVGVFSHPRPGRVVLLSAFHERTIVLSRNERELLARVALHIDAADRIRSSPEQIKAVLDADGRVLHREEDAPSATSLTRHVARAKASPSPLELWPVLIAGKSTLVRRSTKGKVSYLLLENPPQTHPLRAWSNGEVDAVTQAARGLSTKLVSYALGVSASEVSRRIGSAAGKVGAASRTELVRLAAMLNRDPRAPFPEAKLTAAESEILDLLQRGLSNRDIARSRSRSVRTIANQVASLLRKTEASSRRDLIVRTLPR